tara:strand:+ start:957 stop:1208 length:252 start_codon:yes stop_codon:yes gene_type:complete
VKELLKLERDGVNVNLPVPGAKVENGQLVANSAFPHLVIQYSTDGGQSWSEYTSPVSVSGKNAVQLRTTLKGKKFSRVTQLTL